MKTIACGRNWLSNKAPGSNISSLFLTLPTAILAMIGNSRAGEKPVT